MQLDVNGDGIEDLMLPVPAGVSETVCAFGGCGASDNGPQPGCSTNTSPVPWQQPWTYTPLTCNTGPSIAVPTDGESIGMGAYRTVNNSSYWVVYDGLPGMAGRTTAPELDDFAFTNLVVVDNWWNNSFFRPLPVDVDGDGRDDLLTPVLPNQATGAYGGMEWWHSDGPTDRLMAISDGLNVYGNNNAAHPSVSILYGNLIDQSIATPSLAAHTINPDPYLYQAHPGTTNCPEKYPRKCVVSTQPVVTRYSVTDGQGSERNYTMGYRNGRYDLYGRGWLGFGEVFSFDNATGTGRSQLFDNVTAGPLNTYPYAGRVDETITWTPNLPSATKPGQVELTYTYDTPNALQSLPGITYYDLVTTTETISSEGNWVNANYPYGYRTYAHQQDPYAATPPSAPATILSDATWKANTWDSTWGNVTTSTSTINGVDLVNTTTTNYNNDAPSWIIKRPNFAQVCSAALGVTLCPNKSIGYTTLGERQCGCESRRRHQQRRRSSRRRTAPMTPSAM